ncbi:uncharacterized protein B0H18DRAFT_360350 [Fomitopsis serialis]|uniref:uncharacterized protein n=1 Tax=Fomitopsis serialis TaxID=139415 RepID=UPI002008AA2B|nr:uncharacterized protein B0H18DRAFT_360350 [Neoantrodia serialis]KAH9926021.1 hypothetical protein B0H18DRAFT_360350 [Neoantrodia serialis]
MTLNTPYVVTLARAVGRLSNSPSARRPPGHAAQPRLDSLVFVTSSQGILTHGAVERTAIAYRATCLQPSDRRKARSNTDTRSRIVRHPSNLGNYTSDPYPTLSPSRRLPRQRGDGDGWAHTFQRSSPWLRMSTRTCPRRRRATSQGSYTATTQKLVSPWQLHVQLCVHEDGTGEAIAFSSSRELQTNCGDVWFSESSCSAPPSSILEIRPANHARTPGVIFASWIQQTQPCPCPVSPSPLSSAIPRRCAFEPLIFGDRVAGLQAPTSESARGVGVQRREAAGEPAGVQGTDGPGCEAPNNCKTSKWKDASCRDTGDKVSSSGVVHPLSLTCSASVQQLS